MPDAPKTRISLILRLQQPADAEAWQQFSEIYQPLILRIARSRGLQDADARDLTQEVLVRVAKSVRNWQPDSQLGSFRGWLSTIARNLLIDFLRRQGRQPTTGQRTDIQQLIEEIPRRASPGDNTKASEYFDAEHEKQLFMWAAEKIKPSFQPQTWQAFWATTVESRSVAEVAVELQMSKGNLYVSRSRVIARLRKTIEAATEQENLPVGKSACRSTKS